MCLVLSEKQAEHKKELSETSSCNTVQEYFFEFDGMKEAGGPNLLIC